MLRLERERVLLKRFIGAHRVGLGVAFLQHLTEPIFCDQRANLRLQRLGVVG